ncbi:MAG: hypothetical protein PHR53_06745, partial [Bacteroidales bacterium]|nr:hypothetical protein [Bacteroidales bacterium]
MKKILTLFAGLFLAFTLSAQVDYLYDFNSLTVGSQNFHGQNYWSTHYQTAATSPDFNVDYMGESLISPDESVAIWYPYGGPGVGRTATRKATPDFDFNFTNGGIIDLELDMYHAWWGTFFGVGYDADGDGNILIGMSDGDGGIYLRCAGSGNNHQPNLVLPNGTDIQITSYTQTDSARYKLSFDFN